LRYHLHLVEPASFWALADVSVKLVKEKAVLGWSAFVNVLDYD